jgi:hypothetical protein
MPLETWMPKWDARSSHQVEINAEPARVYATLLSIDFGRNPLVRVLMFLRSIPAVLFSPREARARWREARAADCLEPTRHLLSGAFTQLEATPPVEMVLGLTGRFWTPDGGLVPTEVATFGDPLPAGLARAAWNFQIEPVAPGRSRLSTETRVLCADPATRKDFLRYWRVIRGGSGAIRWALLRQIKSQAERG